METWPPPEQQSVEKSWLVVSGQLCVKFWCMHKENGGVLYRRAQGSRKLKPISEEKSDVDSRGNGKKTWQNRSQSDQT